MNIEPLKKKIQAANPEIMELKWGCEFRPAGDSSYGTLIKVEDDCWRILWADGSVGIVPVSDCAVYGRPIRLADVLVAMDEKAWEVYPVSEISKLERTVELWNLLDDNLDHQSDECKQFLTDLLV